MSDPRHAAMELIFGRWRSQILHAGVALGLIDAVAGGRRAAVEVAEARSLEPERTYRLLRALACVGVLEERDGRRFVVTELGELFAADHPRSLRAMTLLEEGPQHYAVWTHLREIVRTGSDDGFVREFGRHVFEHVSHDPDYGATFDAAMTSYSAGESAMVLDMLSGVNLDGVTHVCDVAGGLGHLAASLLAANPTWRATVIDLPSVTARVDARWAAPMGVAERCDYVAGDMFESVPTADAYTLKHILHDWNDADSTRILKSIHRAAPAGARLLVAEFVVPGPDTPHFAKLFDIHMMVAVGGKERTEAEYATLFERSGWRLVQAHSTAIGPLGLVEAVKA